MTRTAPEDDAQLFGKPMPQHGTAIALGDDAALIIGKPGSGKSDLALRCMSLSCGPGWSSGPRLIGDDQVLLSRAIDTPDKIRVACAPSIEGLLEVRGYGLIRLPPSNTPAAVVRLVVALGQGISPRMPDPGETTELLGLQVRQIRLDPFEPSAAHKALAILANLSAPKMP